jgi:TonB-dependent receptor
LDPLTTVQFDLGLWHFFDQSSGQVYVDLFHKHIDSFTETVSITPFNFAAAGIPVPINPATGVPYLNGTYQTAINNTQGGSFKGIEVGFLKTRFLSGKWSGLGVSADVTKTLSNVVNQSTLGGPSSNQSFPGLSEYVENAQVFYDTKRFSARLAVYHRTSFVTSYQLAVNYEQVYAAPETVWNFQTSYRLTRNLSMLFQGLNLSDAPSQTYFSTPQQPATLQYFGRTFYLGFNYNL